jgi:hypothetical protein
MNGVACSVHVSRSQSRKTLDAPEQEPPSKSPRSHDLGYSRMQNDPRLVMIIIPPVRLLFPAIFASLLIAREDFS